jgi:hypothetical protein
MDGATIDNSKTQHVSRWLTLVRLMLIGLWIGAAIYFSFGVAPSVFKELPSRELAGAVVQRTLALINLGGFFIGVLALLLRLISRRSSTAFRFGAELFALVVLTVATAVGHWVIAARMHALKLQIGVPIDLVPLTSPIRASFNQWHGYSVMVLTVAMVAALAAWLLAAGNTRIPSSRSN